MPEDGGSMAHPARTRALDALRRLAALGAPVVALDALRTLAALGAPVVALDLGGTYLRVALAGGGAIRVRAYPTAELRRTQADGIVPGIVEAVLAEVECGEQAFEPAAVGVGVAAYVAHDGAILGDRPFGLLAGLAVRDRLAEALGVPVSVDNDANLAALAEVEEGAARGLSDVAVVTLGTNIGLGIVVGGRIVRGAHGAAGEAGDLLVPARRGRDGRALVADAGRLGHGTTLGPDHYAHLEDLVGGAALLRSLMGGPAGARMGGPAGARTNGNSPPERIAPGGDGIFHGAAAGDRRAAAAIRHGIEGWAMLIANLTALLDPQAVVVSGGLAEEAPAFIEPLRRRAAELCSFVPDIRVGELGAQAGLAGAVIVARSVLPTGAESAALAERFVPSGDATRGRSAVDGPGEQVAAASRRDEVGA